jgi:hypothetical protein
MWCKTMLKRRLTTEQIQERIHTLEEWAEKTMPSDGRFALKWLGTLVQKIDDLWYDSKLLSALMKSYGGLKIRMDVNEPTIAGYVVESHDRSSIRLHMNRDLFIDLFDRKTNTSYHAGGLVCRTRFNCFLHVLLHETVHLLLTLCDKTGEVKETSHHDKNFQTVIRNWFGHQEQQHGLIDGFHPQHDMNTLKAYVRKGALVEAFENGNWIPGRVVQRGSKWIVVKECCKRQPRLLQLHIGLLRIPSP